MGYLQTPLPIRRPIHFRWILPLLDVVAIDLHVIAAVGILKFLSSIRLPFLSIRDDVVEMVIRADFIYFEELTGRWAIGRIWLS